MPHETDQSQRPTPPRGSSSRLAISEDILPCKAVHRDGNAVYFHGEWKSLPLAAFWSRHCKGLMSPHTRLPAIWQFELMQANRGNAQTSDFVDDEDLADFIYESDVAGPAA